jgi:hypothetical protein
MYLYMKECTLIHAPGHCGDRIHSNCKADYLLIFMFSIMLFCGAVCDTAADRPSYQPANLGDYGMARKPP